ncbi:MAG: P-loop NTPase [Phycisphaerales bacterium]
MPISKESIRDSLRRVVHPLFRQDLLTCGGVRKVAVCDGFVSVTIAGGGLSDQQVAGLREAVSGAIREDAARAGEQIADLHIEITSEPAVSASDASKPPTAAPTARPPQAPGEAARAQQAMPELPGVRHIIAVGAGKGGVGKSTVAVNLAVGLARQGHAVGLMDGDIYGPSLPTMLGLESLETAVLRGMLQPFLVHGVKAMTIGKLVEPDKPLIWRGPMAHGAFKQLATQTEWGELDYLIIDLPPGTGDVSLTMAQLLRLSGAVVVCTPQKVAQDDAVRAAKMYQQLGIEVLGVVENMSYFVGDDGKEYDLFGRGGAERMAARLGVPFLGAIPITMSLRENSDSGNPTANFTDSSPRGRDLRAALERMVSGVESQVALSAMRAATRRPTLKIS